MKTFIFAGAMPPVLLLAALSLAACSSTEPDSTATADAAAEHQAIVISAEHRAEAGLDVAEVGPGELQNRLALYGSLEIPPSHYLELMPRYAGTVRSVSVSLGESVKAGQALARIDSNDSLVSYTLTSPMAGRVLMLDARGGSAAAPDRALFVIADASTLWARLAVPSVDAGKVRVGQPLALLDSNGQLLAHTTLAQLLPLIDRERQTVQAYAKLPNPEGRLAPGQFVRAEVVIESRRAAVVVPGEAIQSLDAGPVVFVETAAGFMPQPVTLGLDDGREVEILEGLQPGQRIAVSRSYLLKSEWLTQGEEG
ncbi:efflux RND transporter periplasmic adaptor subunit [Algiphilus sp. W345]|uniref:Efflux RND transporter periplasmic adaptor subunit n=1 Tax=Banduia mediterranea TaxID=3075609 RepID=A0ABU2WJ52_9GAMM|nr:efflux RND transporter periplasmic adaptor subunit [Algiphilus sp. W345]MDT0497578.1 efflux RND transporter periplasmic adaptor subunit [Algiphilus sp. W345]